MNPSCPQCGLEIESASATFCPKCEAPIRKNTNGRLYLVDVVHAGEDRYQALNKLEKAIDEAVYGNFRGIKVIHGRGSTTGIGLLKPHLVAAMKRAAVHYGGKVVPDRDNPGAHLLWFE